MSSDGQNKTLLTRVGHYSISPRWSPHGDRILYLRGGGGAGLIASTRITDLQGRSIDLHIAPESRVIDGDSVYYNLADVQWAPSGNEVIIWGSVGKRPEDPSRGPSGELFLLDINSGRILRRLTCNSVDEAGFQLSADGRRIVLVRGPYQTGRSLHIMDLQEGVLRQITTGPNDNFPRWGNNATHVLLLKDENPDPWNSPERDGYRIYTVNTLTPLVERRILEGVVLNADLYILP